MIANIDGIKVVNTVDINSVDDCHEHDHSGVNSSRKYFKCLNLIFIYFVWNKMLNKRSFSYQILGKDHPQSK